MTRTILECYAYRTRVPTEAQGWAHKVMSQRIGFIAPTLSCFVRRVIRTTNLSPIQTSSKPCLHRTLMAGAVAPPAAANQPTIFDKIIAKEIPAKIVYEDDDVMAFHDVAPQAPIHVLLIPKRRISMLSTAKESDKELLGNLMLKVDLVADRAGLAEGYRVIINNGPNGLQSVYHLHLHIVGGRKLKWGPF